MAGLNCLRDADERGIHMDEGMDEGDAKPSDGDASSTEPRDRKESTGHTVALLGPRLS